jgi:hypothetical protein
MTAPPLQQFPGLVQDIRCDVEADQPLGKLEVTGRNEIHDLDPPHLPAVVVVVEATLWISFFLIFPLVVGARQGYASGSRLGCEARCRGFLGDV